MKRVLLALLAIAALVAAGCGSDNGDGGSGAPERPSVEDIGSIVTNDSEGKAGGDVTYLAASDIDHMDPGQTYYTFGIMIHTAVGRPLFAISPDADQERVPDLAEAEPKISADNKTITVKIRSGVKYAPPVDREVTSKDVKYAIERAFTTSVPNGYATSYFNDIEGAPADAPIKIEDLKPFSGLQTPDDNTLVIKLTKPTAGLVDAALVMPITIPVPEDYAGKYDQEVPTAYDQYMTASGPYMIKNDTQTGELTGFDVGKKIEIVRNPNWDPETDHRPAYLDSITIEEGNTDETVASRRILDGENLIGIDSAVPPAAILRDLLTKYKTQYGRVPSGGAHWSSFNTQKAPFDNVNVRKAILANANRDAIRKVYGGEVVGPIQQHYIPPGVDGYEEAGGEEGFTDLDFTASETGDPEVARKYMDLAEQDGVDITDGKYTGDVKPTMVTANTPDGLRIAETIAADMRNLGFEPEIRQVGFDTLYTKFCGVEEQVPHMCIGVGWSKDFNDAQTVIAPIFDSSTIKPAGNVNWSLLDSPEVDAAIAKAIEAPAGEERNQAWADADRAVSEQAPTLLHTWDDTFSIASENINGVMNTQSAGWDLSFTSVK